MNQGAYHELVDGVSVNEGDADDGASLVRGTCHATSSTSLEVANSTRNSSLNGGTNGFGGSVRSGIPPLPLQLRLRVGLEGVEVVNRREERCVSFIHSAILFLTRVSAIAIIFSGLKRNLRRPLDSGVKYSHPPQGLLE